MPRTGSGAFTRVHDWTADADAGIDIRADRMDEDSDDIAQALSDSIAKDGQTVPTANLPMGGFKHTGVADASANNQYATLGQLIAGSLQGANEGSVTLPDGTIIKYGRDNTTGSPVVVTFDDPFPDTCVAACAVLNSSGPNAVSVVINDETNMTIYKGGTSFAYWWAIGY